MVLVELDFGLASAGETLRGTILQLSETYCQSRFVLHTFTTKGVYDDQHQHLSFAQGGGHGGSHPHLVHEFLSSIVEARPSFPDVYQSCNWTCAGLCAHDSAMNGGQVVQVPNFRT